MTKGSAIVIGNTDGIGLALTRQLLDHGFEVIGFSRRASGLRHEAYRHCVVDVCDRAYPELLRQNLPGKPLRLCIYCAGIGERFALETMALETLTLEVNLMGVARTAEVVVPHMAQNGRGVLVGLSSLADLLPSSHAPAYAASKSGMTYYLEGLATALASKGVAVMNVRLGFVDTKMSKSPWKPFMLSAEDAAQRILKHALRNRIRNRLDIPRRAALTFGTLAPLVNLAMQIVRRNVRVS